MSKVLVTGAAGYIGSVFVSELLAKGYEVVALDNFMYGQTSLLGVAHNKNLTIVHGDVRDEELMKELLRGVEYIVPLAALVGAPICDRDPVAAKTINLEAIKLLLRLRTRGQKLIFPTTNSGYGVGQEGMHCTEDTPLNPVSLYGRTKVEAERAVLAQENTLSLRLATVFGISPRMRIDLLVNDFVFRALNDRFVVLFEADFKRNYIHVRDVAGVIMHATGNFETMKGEAYNVGLSDANLSKRELCEEIQKQLPDFVFTESAIGKDPDKRNYIVSNEKIEKTGFKPQIPLGEGITELIKGYTIIRARKRFGNV